MIKNDPKVNIFYIKAFDNYNRCVVLYLKFIGIYEVDNQLELLEANNLCVALFQNTHNQLRI